MDVDAKREIISFLGKHLDAVGYAGELAWNLREGLRECSKNPSLRPVLDSLLPRQKAELELKLIDDRVSSDVPSRVSFNWKYCGLSFSDPIEFHTDPSSQ